MTLKTGSLGMIVIGLTYLAIARQRASSGNSGIERMAPMLCVYGLVAELVTAGVGYVICVYVWGNFYFTPIQTGKNVWLIAQALSIAAYVIGVFLAVAGICRAASQ